MSGATAAAGRVPAADPPPVAHRRSLGSRIRRRVPGAASVLVIAFAMLIMFGPVLMLALFSFNDSSIISLPWEGFTTRWYDEAWSTPEARDAIVNSLLVAAVVTVGSLTLGTLAAWGLTRLRFPGRGPLAGLHGSVLVVPWLIIGVAGLIFFSESGVSLSLTTVALMQLVVTFPLVVAIISAGLVRFSRSVEEAAIDLGASQGQMLRYIVLPQIAPSLAAASIFAFAWSFNNFEVSFFTGGFEQTFPVWVFSILRQSENLPMVNAVSTVIALAQVIVVFAGWRLMKRLTRDRGGDKALTELLTGGGALMEAASLPVRHQRRRGRSLLRPLAFMAAPTALLLILFLGPMIAMLVISLQHGVLSGDSGFTLSNFTDVIGDPLYRDVAWTTVQIATIAMLIQLCIAVPIAYVLAYKAGRFEVPLLLFLVLADELNPMVRIYAWRMLLGREGLINEGLQRIGLIDAPIDALLFSKFAVIVVLSTSYLTYTVIPIYAAMKAVDKNLFEAARDLGAGWWTTTRRVLLPLIAPGIFVSLLLVYIPLFTDFASPTLVGGTSGYMLGQVVNDLVLETGDLNGGAAMSLLMLFASGIFAIIAYKLAKIRQLET